MIMICTKQTFQSIMVQNLDEALETLKSLHEDATLKSLNQETLYEYSPETGLRQVLLG